jgi:uncharacterized protein YcfJ
MNKSMLIGTVLGVTIATAGGVMAGYQYLNRDSQASDKGSATAETASSPPVATVAAQADPTADTPPAAASPATVQQECWDEVVTHTAEPKDDKRIAGTAIGAVIGGAVAKDLGDRNLTTAVGAAVGAYAGNKVQQKVQEKNTYTTTERRCRPVEQ